MAKSFSTVAQFDAPARALFELYADPIFQQDKALTMGALSATATRRELPDGKVEIVLELVRPGHGGAAEEHATMTMELDPESFGSRWRQVVKGYESRASVHGSSTVRALGPERCELRVDGEIDIRVPLLGRMIERKIVDAIHREAPREEDFIRRSLSGRLA